MAIRIVDEFPGKVDPVSGSWPDGQLKNETIPNSSNDGTPADELWLSDYEGLKQWFIKESGIVPSGTPDNALVNQQGGALLSFISAANKNNWPTIGNGADADHDIDFNTGIMLDSSSGVILRLASALTKQIDAAWTAGDALGGLFSGAVAIDTWYHVFLIRKDSDGTIDAGFDTSVTAANIPAGYTSYRRIGSVLTDGSANILGFNQSGDNFVYDEVIEDLSVTAPGVAAVLATLSTPPGIEVDADLSVKLEDASTINILITPISATDVAASVANGTIRATAGGSAGQISLIISTDTSSQIRYRSDLGSGLVFFKIATKGWIDNRGQN